ncbi:hypothetical protein DY000_02055743 [Brassica cretica]|uniref:Uncharacterized protein n=1 Tax=Brassica cretica TaxID=69181 RepID=A0ABQ7A7I1_BRACR|nr:hypothetical protein DY000_02055743 [Brassica cretica]
MCLVLRGRERFSPFSLVFWEVGAYIALLSSDLVSGRNHCSRLGVSGEMETLVLGILVLFNFSCVLGGRMRSRCLMTLSDGLKMVLSMAASFGLRMRSRSRSIDALC